MSKSGSPSLGLRRGYLVPTAAFAHKNILLFLTIGLLLAFSTVNSHVVSIDNLKNILIQSCYLMIFASAQMMVILTRGFDLSLGVTVSLVSVVASMAMVAVGGDPVWQITIGFIVALATGCAVGALNGFAVAILKVNPFVVTLATWNIVLTLSSSISGGFPVDHLPIEFSTWFAQAHPMGIPIQVILTALLLLVLAWTLTRTIFGRAVYLTGSNPKAALLAGLRTRATLFFAYVTGSALVAMGAFLLTARTGSGEPNLGGSLTMVSIAAAVIGGVSLRGGEGRIQSPIIGALFVTILSNGMNLLRVNGSLQQIILGLVIIGALLIDRFRSDTR